jgi:hypothetical protein
MTEWGELTFKIVRLETGDQEVLLGALSEWRTPARHRAPKKAARSSARKKAG